MSAHKALNTSDTDIRFKPALTQARKVAGRVVEEEIETPSFTDDDIGGLLAGISSNELEAGRERIARENPEYASKIGGDMIRSVADMEFEQEDLGAPTTTAGSKRFGSLMDKETNNVIDFKKLSNGLVQLSSPDNGEVLETLSSAEFDEVLESNEYMVL